MRLPNNGGTIFNRKVTIQISDAINIEKNNIMTILYYKYSYIYIYIYLNVLQE